MDGSCHRHVVKELSRAGWAVTMVGKDGELLGVLKGPVWAPWPQTPQAAEYAAFAFCGAYAD
eukprot:1950596-Pyramimonas_sp.AAC.1